MGILSTNDNRWTLVVKDESGAPVIKVGGQFIASNAVENVGASYSVGGAGRQDPIIQWTGGESETITFNARIWHQLGFLDQSFGQGAAAAAVATGATTTAAGLLGGSDAADKAAQIGEGVAAGATFISAVGLAASEAQRFGIGVDQSSLVKDQIDKLKRMVRRDNALGRPPICQFDYGSEISMLCVVQSIGGIQYDDIQSNGLLRGATLQITLRKFVQAAIEENDAATLESSTLFRFAKQGDTFDSLGRRFYGNPLKGVNLRFINLTITPEPQAGDLVKVLEPSNSQITRKVVPRSIPFQSTAAVTQLKVDKLAARQGAFTPILGV